MLVTPGIEPRAFQHEVSSYASKPSRVIKGEHLHFVGSRLGRCPGAPQIRQEFLRHKCRAQYVVGRDTRSDSASDTGLHPACTHFAPYALAGIAGLVEIGVNAHQYLVPASAPGVKPGITTWSLQGVGNQSRAYQELDDEYATTLPSEIQIRISDHE